MNKICEIVEGGCFRSIPGFEEMAFALSTELDGGRTATQVRGKGPRTEGLACFRSRSTGQTSSTYFLCEKAKEE